MNKEYSDELKRNIEIYISKGTIDGKNVFLFGHCEATIVLLEMLIENNIIPVAILDNNENKYNLVCKGVCVEKPEAILQCDKDNTVVLIATRYYESMKSQLRRIGFDGPVLKTVDYNTYSEYSLSEETKEKKHKRLEHGMHVLDRLKSQYPGCFFIFCPYSSLGDIYYCLSYVDSYLEKRNQENAVICVYSNSCAEVGYIFGKHYIEILSHADLDSAVQAVLFLRDNNCFIAHNDKPYVMYLTKALKIKRITFENIYKCGVFSLPLEEKPSKPLCWEEFSHLKDIPKGKSVILAPYAGSVVLLDYQIWLDIRDYYRNQGYAVYTNVSGDEKPIENTIPLAVRIREMKSVVEHSGTFIGLRSGICDVIRTADCKKIALYPDYNFSDTKWKSIDVFSLDGFENIVIKDGTEWKRAL